MKATLAGQVAVVTGGAVRVGRAISRALGEAQSRLVIHYHSSRDEAMDLVHDLEQAGGEAIAVCADLTKPAQVRRLRDQTLRHFGQVDLLVNNAAIMVRTPFLEITADEWDRLLNTNLKSVFLACRLFGEAMWQRGRGSIVNIADVSALRPWPNYIPYCVSKAGVVALTQGLAHELAPRVRVNAIAPGVVVWSDQFTPAQRRRRLAQVPLRRIGRPEDVARAVLFLAESEYVTGAVLPVDGGRHLA